MAASQAIRPRSGWAPPVLFLSALGGGLLLAACELDEVSVAVPEDVLVVEAYVMVGDKDDEATAFLHWTLGTRSTAELLGATVTLLTQDTVLVTLASTRPSECVFQKGFQEVEGVCYSAGRDVEDIFEPGTRTELTVRLADGRELRGGTNIPLNIQLLQPPMRTVCGLPPGLNLEFTWNQSPGAWAYAAETEITGLTAALAAKGIQVESDSVALLGLAVSESDTTIVFPREFGVFDRFDLDQDVAVALQEGLPEGAIAEVVVAALDRNYVNWVRGGNFNPSGTVRVSSLRGDGIGVLGSAVRRAVQVIGTNPNTFIPGCFAES